MNRSAKDWKWVYSISVKNVEAYKKCSGDCVCEYKRLTLLTPVQCNSLYVMDFDNSQQKSC